MGFGENIPPIFLLWWNNALEEKKSETESRKRTFFIETCERRAGKPWGKVRKCLSLRSRRREGGVCGTGGGGSRQALLNLVCSDVELCPRLQQRPRVAVLFLKEVGWCKSHAAAGHCAVLLLPPRMPQLASLPLWHPWMSFFHSQKPPEMVTVVL